MTSNVMNAAMAFGIRNLERPKCNPVNKSVKGLPIIANTAEIRM